MNQPIDPNYVKSLESIAKAVKKECQKFNFPDEDRPDLWAALQQHEQKFGKV